MSSWFVRQSVCKTSSLLYRFVNIKKEKSSVPVQTFSQSVTDRIMLIAFSRISNRKMWAVNQAHPIIH